MEGLWTDCRIIRYVVSLRDVLDSLSIEIVTTRNIALGLKRDFLKRAAFCDSKKNSMVFI